MSALGHVYGVLRGLVPTPVYCDLCGDHIPALSRRDTDILRTHGRLLCPCGGSLWSIYRLNKLEGGA